ncbi:MULTISPECIES: hypothetical protein [Pectobacterium]|uniref:Uncharacterized protein n=1 Tax=Pectobacterium carotovorum subsp. carotovorum TaxID=555 RepID=A0AAI9KXY3_PECCC|nr:hypothetical protein [Pectobacterium carotovorum]KHT26709.1 hypothetical protein RC98_13460 [Pectobacterium carotovorum subsp. carotovorum]GKV90438.1 hypothetical protein PEC301619_24200 [Pectobacterium carotovorum subsp. carotovorum]GKW03147.1 hypothetical protein PEC301877_19620 [Pectobacterium carotovorum subsp. carotovorum]GKX46653.1 hypothetical protein SOASR016_14050 [Pectobacterium carotovorum subsp. carotovorum]GLV68576.1 hypothetical protein Pcaca03_10200 [Pectobacterium carotovoru
MAAITTEKELAKALKEEKDTITIEGDLAKKTIKIKATGKIAWAIALAAIGIAVGSAIATAGTGGAAAPVTGATALLGAGGAVGVLGATTTTSAIAIAIAAGGVGVLTRLRKYTIVDKSDSRVVLRRS